MIKKVLITALIVSASSLSSYAAPKIGGKLEVLSATTNQAVSQAKVGTEIKIRVNGENGKLVENKQLNVRYVFSVVPDGSNTPITLSGKLSLKASDAQVVTDGLGSVIYEVIYLIPGFFPAGVASMSISGEAADAGSVTLDKSIQIVL